MPIKKKKESSHPQVHILDASAGSGKTYALAKKYVQLLLGTAVLKDDSPFKSTLAITFTNASTLEMKERILEFLKRIALGQFKSPQDEKELLSSLSIDRTAARVASSRLLEFLFRHYNFFAVKTIDSFINSLLTGCALSLGFSAHFDIKKEVEDYLAYSFDSLIDKTSGDPALKRMFEDFLEHYLEVEERTAWNPKPDLLKMIKKLYDMTNAYGKRFVRTDAAGRELMEKRSEIYALLLKLREKAPERTDKRFMDTLRRRLEKPKGAFSVIDSLAFLVKRDEFPVNKGFAAPAEVSRLFESVKNRSKEYAELEADSFFNPYVDILNAIMDELEAIKTKEDILFLSELNSRARTLLTEGTEGSVTVPELYLRIATRFRHYLIDEFQDTSQLQWDNLYPMVKEALDSGGSLFYVGDKKQAIYRFRGGNVELFDELKNKTFAAFAPHVEPLCQNWRSQKAIVEWNNRIFSGENLKKFLGEREISDDSKEQILGDFKGAKQDYQGSKDRGYVKIEVIHGDTKDEREPTIKARMLELLDELKDRFKWGDIAILTRDNDEIELVTKWLLEQNIPVESDKTLSIKENPIIKELTSFIAFLLSPIDNLSFASFVLGEIFEKASGLDRLSIEDFLFEFRKKHGQNEYFYRDFRKAFPESWSALIDPFFKSVGFVPMYEFIISIMERFEVPANFPEHQAFLMRFIELVKKREEQETSLDTFLNFFNCLPDEESFVHVTQANSVRIKTIHKSKGLDFGVVVIPFLEMEMKTANTLVVPREEGLALVRIKKDYNIFSDELEGLYMREHTRSLIDELNVVYVAFTRAKYELYAFLPEKSGNSKNTAVEFIPESLLEAGTKIKYEEKKEAADIPQVSPSVYQNWLPLLKKEFVKELSIQNRGKMRKGDVIHKVFSFIGNLKGQDKEKAVRQAVEKTRFLYPDADLAGPEGTVRETLSKEDLKPFFAVERGEICREKEIVDKNGETHRIDRLIVAENEALILDYKSSKDFADEDRKQVREYMDLIKELFPKLKVRGFLLFLDELVLEEVLWSA
jgi:ATP-dependent exoDNAse (exonuclease V) beta subunit